MKNFTTNNILPEVEMNQIKIRPVLAYQTVLALNCSLYDIESVNTTEAMILASPAESTERQDVTNVFYIQKISDEAELLTAVPEGKIRLTKTVETEDSEQTEELVAIYLKSAEFMNE